MLELKKPSGEISPWKIWLPFRDNFTFTDNLSTDTDTAVFCADEAELVANLVKSQYEFQLSSITRCIRWLSVEDGALRRFHVLSYSFASMRLEFDIAWAYRHA